MRPISEEIFVRHFTRTISLAPLPFAWTKRRLAIFSMAGWFLVLATLSVGAQNGSDDLAPPSAELDSATSEKTEETSDRPKRPKWKEHWERLTSEQRQQAEEFRRKAREMTPEQRREAMEKMPFLKELKSERQGFGSKEFKGGPRDGKKEAQREEMRKKWESLTPEQRQQAEEFRRKAREMTPEQRREAMEKMPFLKGLKPERPEGHPPFPEGESPRSSLERGGPEERLKHERMHSEMKERWEKLTPEEKEQVREFRKKAAHMTPEERREAAAKLPIFQNMSPEQRAALEKRMQHFEKMPPEKREKVLKNFERWQKMNASEREEFRKKFKHRRESGGEPGLASSGE